MLQFLALLLTFALACPAALAANSSNTTSPSAVFVFNTTETNRTFVFALNAVQDTGDLYFHLEAPAGHAWIAVGIGSEMKDSLILSTHASNSQGTNATISPRIARGHTEPAYAPSINITQLDSSTTSPFAQALASDDKLRASGICHNCTTWLSPSGSQHTLDLHSPSAPFIFALGPTKPFSSADPSAPLRRHALYGHFTLDMRSATSPSPGSVPSPNAGNGTYFVSAHSSPPQAVVEDYTSLPAAHALLMLGSLLVLFPLSSLVLRVLHKALWHGVIQALAVLLILAAVGVGMYLASMYEKSRGYGSAHQIMGLLVLFALGVQAALGVVHHRRWKVVQVKTVHARVHGILGPGVWVLGIANAGVGFRFAGNGQYVARFVVVVLAVAVGYLGVRMLAWRCTGGRKQQGMRKWFGSERRDGGDDSPPEYSSAVPLKQFPGRA